jgi:hypothetical protein
MNVIVAAKNLSERRAEMERFIKLTIFVIAVFLLGCAGVAPQLYNFENSLVFKGSFDEIWATIIETFAERNIPISNMEKASGFITTQEIKFPPEYADCGATPIGIKFGSSGVLGTFNVFVKEVSSEQYKVAINAHYRFITDNPFYEGCTSKGKLEAWFLSNIKGKLKSNHED